MSTQQDIYAADSENRPPMLNKENYIPWSSHLLRYAKSRPNRKLIYISIINGPYVRRIIPEPGDANREVEADDQAIQTIFLGLPEDIYAVVDSCETAQEIWLRVQQMMKGSDIGIQKRRLSCLMNGKAQAEDNATGNNAEEFDLMTATTDLDEIEEVNANCILMANLQQASTLGTQTDKAPVYDSNGSAEVQVKMEMEIPRSSGVYFITACSYSIDTSKELMKGQVYALKLL
nr:hypothetical protein [Tanacetum cinerariifolium]